MNPEPTPDEKPPLIKITQPAQHGRFARAAEYFVAVFVVLMLAGIAFPVYNTVNLKGDGTKALANAKQIGLALKLFAGDHDGSYPRRGIPREMSDVPSDSNTAFACLFPTYTQSETIFGNKLSAYQTQQPDNVIDDPYTGVPKETLQPGENVYAYVMGLQDSDAPHTPLVVDGTDGTGHYNTNPATWGGIWKGTRAVFIRLDNSGGLETLTGPDNARYVPAVAPLLPGQTLGTNVLDFSHSGKDLRLLDPAVGPRRR